MFMKKRMIMAAVLSTPILLGAGGTAFADTEWQQTETTAGPDESTEHSIHAGNTAEGSFFQENEQSASAEGASNSTTSSTAGGTVEPPEEGDEEPEE